MDYLQTIAQLAGGFGWVGIVVMLLILQRAGILSMLLKKNGSVDKKLEDIETNHLHDIATKLDKLIEINNEQLFILRRLDDKK